MDATKLQLLRDRFAFGSTAPTLQHVLLQWRQGKSQPSTWGLDRNLRPRTALGVGTGAIPASNGVGSSMDFEVTMPMWGRGPQSEYLPGRHYSHWLCGRTAGLQDEFDRPMEWWDRESSGWLLFRDLAREATEFVPRSPEYDGVAVVERWILFIHDIESPTSIETEGGSYSVVPDVFYASAKAIDWIRGQGAQPLGPAEASGANADKTIQTERKHFDWVGDNPLPKGWDIGNVVNCKDMAQVQLAVGCTRPETVKLHHAGGKQTDKDIHVQHRRDPNCPDIRFDVYFLSPTKWKSGRERVNNDNTKRN
jgi:hypothetical protein